MDAFLQQVQQEIEDQVANPILASRRNDHPEVQERPRLDRRLQPVEDQRR